jgi:hypothetical protein
MLEGLEGLRFALGVEVGREVGVKVTHCLRTRPLSGDPDAVPFSMHKAEYGGIAVDVTCYEVRSGAVVSQQLVGEVAGRIFDWVKWNYVDGHVHCDMRSVVGR